ncbi:MAG: GDYXXLXY domain-containing protein [Deltaproteobacteria bacterium]|nr:GDYXXLXY domain-containing protein [Deltaproteobacteria bacterium]
MTEPTGRTQSRRWSRLIAVLAIQLLILALIPAKKVRALASGRTVILETVPVDPYDPLSGYYVTLAYAVEGAASEATRDDPTPTGDRVGFILVSRSEPAWTYVGVDSQPTDRSDLVAIAARAEGGRWVIDGIGRFYVPETDRDRIEAALSRGGRRALVELRVGDDGTPAIKSLKAGGEVFGHAEE